MAAVAVQRGLTPGCWSSTPLVASAGAVSRRFDGRLGTRAFKPGRYQLGITAVDAAGKAARPVAVPFTMGR